MMNPQTCVSPEKASYNIINTIRSSGHFPIRSAIALQQVLALIPEPTHTNRFNVQILRTELLVQTRNVKLQFEIISYLEDVQRKIGNLAESVFPKVAPVRVHGALVHRKNESKKHPTKRKPKKKKQAKFKKRLTDPVLKVRRTKRIPIYKLHTEFQKANREESPAAENFKRQHDLIKRRQEGIPLYTMSSYPASETEEDPLHRK